MGSLAFCWLQQVDGGQGTDGAHGPGEGVGAVGALFRVGTCAQWTGVGARATWATRPGRFGCRHVQGHKRLPPWLTNDSARGLPGRRLLWGFLLRACLCCVRARVPAGSCNEANMSPRACLCRACLYLCAACVWFPHLSLCLCPCAPCMFCPCCHARARMPGIVLCLFCSLTLDLPCALPLAFLIPTGLTFVSISVFFQPPFLSCLFVVPPKVLSSWRYHQKAALFPPFFLLSLSPDFWRLS